MEVALSRGVPLSEDKAVIKQSRKVDTLIVKIQKEKKEQHKNQQER